MTDHRAYTRAKPFADTVYRLLKTAGISRDITHIRALRDAALFLRDRRSALTLCDVASISLDTIVEQLSVYTEVLGDSLLFDRLVNLLYARRMLRILPEVLERLVHLFAADISCAVVTITAVDPIPDQLYARITERICAWGKYSTVLSDTVYDPSLIAGFIVMSSEGWSADFSIRGSLRFSAHAVTTTLLSY